MTVLEEKVPANFVPAAAVIREGQALFGMIGCKGFVGGLAGCNKNPSAQHWTSYKTIKLEFRRGEWNFRSTGGIGRSRKELQWRRRLSGL